MSEQPKPKEARQPEVGELILGTVKKIDKFGAYVSLDEYEGVEAFIHRSEISLKWVRNIRAHLKEDQRQVFKVVRVSLGRQQIDLSLRRVSQHERREKIVGWKKQQKTNKILTQLRERTKLEEAWVKENIVERINQQGVDLYEAFEQIAEEESIPSYLGHLDKETGKALIELCAQGIKTRKVVAKGILTLSSKSRNGVQEIREVAAAAMTMGDSESRVTLTVIGSPRYLLRVEANDRIKAEQVLLSTAQKTISLIMEKGGKGDFKKT